MFKLWNRMSIRTQFLLLGVGISLVLVWKTKARTKMNCMRR